MEERIVAFFGMIEKEVQKMEYGTMTVNVAVSKGLPVMQTTNIVKQRRIRYKVEKIDNMNV